MDERRKTVAFGEVLFNIPVQSMNLVVYKDVYEVLGTCYDAVCTHLGIGATGSSIAGACAKLREKLQIYIQDIVDHSEFKKDAWTAINNEAFERDSDKENDFAAYHETKHRYAMEMVSAEKSSIQERALHVWTYFIQSLASMKVLNRKAKAFVSYEKLAA